MEKCGQRRCRALTKTFPLCSSREKGLALDKDDVIQVKEAFKWIMQSLVAKELGGGVAVVSKVGDSRRKTPTN